MGAALLTALLVGGIAGVANAQETRLQSEAAELRFEAGRLAGLVHRASGVELVSPTNPSPLFTLYPASGDPTTSLQAQQSSLAVEARRGGRRAVLTYSGFPQPDLSVTVTVDVPARGPLTMWSLRLRSGTPLSLRTVRFPDLTAVPAIGAAEDDVLVLPAFPGTLIRNPAGAWGPKQSVTLRYPGDMSAQFIAYQDGDAGLYLAGQDSAALPRRLVVQRRAEGFELAHEFALDPGTLTEWESPYPCAVGVTQGTWCDSADLYKAWALKQPWCERRLDRRKDIPSWWKAGPLVHVCEVRAYGGDRAQAASFYPELQAHVSDLRERTDSDIVLMLAGWEQHRRWSAGDYFPIFDEAAARPAIAALRADGVHPFVYLSGLFWTFYNEGRDESHPPVPDRWQPAFVRDPGTGEPQAFVLNESRPGSTWKRNSYQFCASAPQTREFLREVVDQLHERGIDVLQMDQTTSGGGAACGSAEHGHSPGAGAYQTHDFARLLADMRSYGKGVSPDSLLLHEEPHEELIPILDGFHVREYKERWWYRGAPGAVGIPLFSYLYHEYAIGYGGDSAGLSAKPDPWCVRTHAVNLVTGRTPGISVWSNPGAVAQSDPGPLTMARQHARLLKRGGAPFLMLGRMLHPLRLEVADMTYQMPAQVAGEWRMEPFVEPAVLTSSWQAPDGRVAHLFVNPTPDAQPLSVDLDTRNLPPWPAARVELYSSADGEELREVAANTHLPYHLQRDVAPLEVVCVVLTHAERG